MASAGSAGSARTRWLIAGAGIGAAAVVTIIAYGPPGSFAPPLEIVDLSARSSGAPALCPWREPDTDKQMFFPGATSFRTETLVFSSLRPRMIARLGPGVPLRDNTLRVYRVFRGAASAGTVLVRAVAGTHGAIEVVVAVAPNGRVVGVRLQRLREPPADTAALTAPLWLKAFRGKTAAARWQMGDDIPAVPETARQSATAIVSAVRALLIEQEVASSGAAGK